MSNAIEVHGLTKNYKNFEAVKSIDFNVAEGEIVAFLGPNGAGKTTTIEILEGYRKSTSGEVKVLGVDPSSAPLSWRENIGIVLQESEPIPELTALESITMHSSYYSNPKKPSDILTLVGLEDSAHQRTRKLSGGQKRRLDLAQALVGDPELVFLDEPTTGFDPSARRESWSMIESLRDLGKTVLLTTHYMDEAEHLADRIIVIDKGELVASGTAKDLANQVNAKPKISWKHRPDDPSPPSSIRAKQTNESWSLESENMVEDLHALTSWAKEKQIELPNLNVSEPTLEDVYLTLVGEGA